MNKTKVKFESQETVTGRVRGSAEWIEYEAILRVKDSEKKTAAVNLVSRWDQIRFFAYTIPNK